MTKRLPLPAPLPRYFHRVSGLGSPPELSALSRGTEPEHHTQHFALRCRAGANSQGRDQLCPLPPALAPPAPHALYEEQLGARGHLRIPPAPYLRWGPVPSACPGHAAGGCGRWGGPEVAVKALPRHHAQDSAPSQQRQGPGAAKKKEYTSDVCPSV